MWYCGVHSQRLFTLLLYHQVHVVVLQDGDHLYLHGPLKRMRSTARPHSRHSLMSQHRPLSSARLVTVSLFPFR